MLTIGFTTKFYTLWDVNSFETSRIVNGEVRWYLKTTFQYLRNLSFDLEAAKEKVMSLGPDTQYEVNLGLHGEKWFFTETEIKDKEPIREYTFTFGRFKGMDIREAGKWELEAIARRMAEIRSQIILDGVDRQISWEQEEALRKFHLKNVIWQLDRAMRMESTARRKVYARRRLIELGELVRRDWFEKVPLPVAAQYRDEYGEPDFDAPIEYKEVRRKWLPKALANWQDTIGDKRGIFYEDGKRIELTLEQVGKMKMFNSEFGTVYMFNLKDQNGNIVTYKGGTRLNIEQGKVFKATATIKHKNNQTFVQRIKMQ